MKNLIFAVLLITTSINAQTIDAPKPHPLLDKQNITALSVAFGIRTFDSIQTCHMLGQKRIVTYPDIHQPGYDFKGGTFILPAYRESEAPVRTCGGIVAWNSGMQALGFGSMLLLHNTGHHRLERITPWVITAGSAIAVIRNFRTRPRAPTGAMLTIR